MTKCDDSISDYVDNFNIYIYIYNTFIWSTLSVIKNKTKIKKGIAQNKKVKDETHPPRIDWQNLGEMFVL